MRYVIIHKSVYLLICVVNFVIFVTTDPDALSIYHGSIALLVLVNLIGIWRGSARIKIYNVEMVHSWLRILMASIIIILLSIFLLLDIFSTQERADGIGSVFMGTLFLSPLFNVVWVPAINILYFNPTVGFAFFAGICIFFAFAEREFLKQLKRNQHLFLRPAEEGKHG